MRYADPHSSYRPAFAHTLRRMGYPSRLDRVETDGRQALSFFAMKINIRRIDASLPLPRHETSGAVGFDLVTRETTVILPGQIGLIPGNVVVEVPAGHALLIVPRSSLPRKKGLVCPHSIGVIDQDYCGPEDEILVQVQNITEQPVTIERGERIAQGMFVQIAQAEWVEEEALATTSRGGFGSTGHA